MNISRRNILGLAAAAIASRTSLAALAPEAGKAFAERSPAEDVTAGLDLRGMTAVVTGCNSGIGYETMRVLALRGAHVIGTARTLQKGRAACSGIKGRTTPLRLELTDFSSVAECAGQIRALRAPVDALVLNAGVILGDLEQVYGLEKQFVVNHLGHFLLANLLLDAVKAAPQGRVVTVGSGNHRDAPPGGIQFDNLSGKGWSGRGYAHSKLANGLFSLELASRLRGTRVTSNCVTPGPARTNILRHVGCCAPDGLRSVEQGAATQCYVAVHPELAGVSGEYFKDCKPAPQSEQQKDTKMAAKLWEVSERLTHQYMKA